MLRMLINEVSGIDSINWDYADDLVYRNFYELMKDFI